MNPARQTHNRPLAALLRFGAVAALCGLCAWYEVAVAAVQLTLE